jgi:hypothetical protein
LVADDARNPGGKGMLAILMLENRQGDRETKRKRRK